MSVYIFGKLFASPAQIADAKRRMVSLVEVADAGILLDSLDDDDQQAIDELAGRAPGVAFSVSSRAGAGDASGLWVEAQRLALSLLSEGRDTALSVTPKSFETIRWPQGYDARIRCCRLGQILHAFALLPDYDKMCLALAEGGIESVHEDRAERCIEAILRAVVLPWDCVSGVLYAWARPSDLDRREAVGEAIGAVQVLGSVISPRRAHL